jgi:2-polyprenyl-3-methyl-5-hydroxy-6-metoxy-1,4-benzoquinol methylase
MTIKDQEPLSDSPWSRPEVVAKFSVSAPNAELMQFASDELRRGSGSRLLDIGCGAGCIAVPLARMGWDVLGTDLSRPMLDAAARRAQEEALTERLRFQFAPMTELPVDDRSCDLIVAHGIWNLARSAAEFRTALGEAARAARPGAALFVFTFSRNTLPPETRPVPGEPFVFTQFSGAPQCFLTEAQLIDELGAAGFEPEPGTPIQKYNLPRPDSLKISNLPVIYEGIFRRRADNS